jgi:transposase
VKKVQVEKRIGLVAPPQIGGERSEQGGSGGATSPAGASAIPAGDGPAPDPEVTTRAERRQYSAAYKLRILREADHCGPGGISALMRREGLYSSHLVNWRRQRERGELAGLNPKKRGRKPVPRNPLVAENERLRRETERLQKRLRQAEMIIEAQKKLCEILGLPTHDPSEKNG